MFVVQYKSMKENFTAKNTKKNGKTAYLTVCDSFFGLFSALNEKLKTRPQTPDSRAFVFCEEKISLMAERSIAGALGGSFNTEVYSFGNFLRTRKSESNLLSKEGSAMVVKKILGETRLNCFNAGKTNIAPALFELIIQLKSAGVSPETLGTAAESTEGILKSKLSDVKEVFSAYENYLKEKGLSDQSTAITELPAVVEADEEIAYADIYIVGFTGFTEQIRRVIRSLIKCAKSVTAILVGGRNAFAYVNETPEMFARAAVATGAEVVKEEYKSGFSKEGGAIAERLFNPQAAALPVIETNKVRAFVAENVRAEVTRVAGLIKEKVLSGERYRDFTVIVPSVPAYENAIKEVFALYEVPYFLDSKKNPSSHPLVTLISAYTEVFRKGFSAENLAAFYKNPLVAESKDFADRFENYVIKYNVNYGGFGKEFLLPAEDEEELKSFEAFRKELCGYFTEFDVTALLEKTRAEEKIKEYTKKLADCGEAVESAVNDQVYEAVIAVLAEIKRILGDEKNISPRDFKSVFTSGIQAMELSVIPQYNDAVFIGGFKEAALFPAKYLFATGLTAEVPAVKEDVALLSDGDINALSEVKVLVEPEIRVVNHRAREETALGLSAFKDRLVLSYPLFSGGKKNARSEVFLYLENAFTLAGVPETKGYLTKKQGLNTFAKEAGRFADGESADFSLPTAYYRAVGGDVAEKVCDYANAEVKERLSSAKDVLLKDVTSPTAIEDFYKCPYRFFFRHGLRAAERKKGEMDGLSAGNLMHEIFKEYLRRVKEVKDEESSAALFKSVSEKVLARPEYAAFSADEEQSEGLRRVLKECKKFCYKNFLWLSSSDFVPDRLEAKFGKCCEYPEIPLLGGKVNLEGKIDRVDRYGKYFRVIDYKTGKAEDSAKKLFSGEKLQLYLYSASVREKGLTPAGAYYMPIAEEYKKPGDKDPSLVIGKTVGEEEALYAQDKNLKNGAGGGFLPEDKSGGAATIGKRTMNAYVDYALKVSENAAKELSEGYILRTPAEGACEYCEFFALCSFDKPAERKVSSVDDETIEQAVKGEDDART